VGELRRLREENLELKWLAAALPLNQHAEEPALFGELVANCD